MRKFILTFHTHFEALTALKLAKIGNFENVKLIAIPRKISSSCGTAISLLAESKTQLDKIKYDEIFECLNDDEFIKID